MIARENASLACEVLLEESQRSVEEHDAKEFFALFTSKIAFAKAERRLFKIVADDQLKFSSVTSFMTGLTWSDKGINCQLGWMEDRDILYRSLGPRKHHGKEIDGGNVTKLTALRNFHRKLPIWVSSVSTR